MNQPLMRTSYFLLIISLMYSSSLFAQNKWLNLVDRDLSQWDIFMGVPHKSSNILGYENVEDVRFGTPIGLNKDPKNVFSVVQENDEPVIKISGEIFAGLVTKQTFQNYHFKAQFKWGDKKWQPRLNQKRNSGILYHSVGQYDDFWNVWMSSLEFEVQQTDTGDFITISEGGVKAESPCRLRDSGKYHFVPHAPRLPLAWHKDFKTGRCWKNGDPEKPHGQWNQVELITYKGDSIHIVNGEVVMTVHKPMYLKGKHWVPMHKGKIQLQSESAEIYYKGIVINNISHMPKEYLHYVNGR